MPRLPPPYPRFCSAQLLHTFSMVQAPPTPTECCADLSRFRRGGKARPPCRHISAPESASPPGRVEIDGSGPVNVLLSVLGPGSPCDRSDPCLAFNPVVDGPGDHRGGTVWEPRMRIGCFELVDASNDGISGNSIPICGSLAIPPPESEPDASLIMPGVIQSSLRSRV